MTSISVAPEVTTVYTLTATNSYGSTVAHATVIVVPLVNQDPPPALLTDLVTRNANQVVLNQYHESLGGSEPPTGDPTLLTLFTSGISVDTKGNVVSRGEIVNLGSYPLSSAAYMYDTSGVKSLFGRTGGTCAQSGLVATIDSSIIASLWFNLKANSYYALTVHAIQNVATQDANACSSGQFLGFSRGRSTVALIQIR